MFTATLFTVAKNEKWVRCPSTEEWVTVVNSSMQDYSVVKGDQLQIHAMPWMRLKNMLSEKSWTEERT